MKIKKLLFHLLATLLAGCIPVMSLHPLYTKKDVVFEEKVLGTWVDDSNDTTWEFQRFKDPPSNEPPNLYELILSDDEGKKGSLATYLVKLKDRFFLDVFPAKFPSGQENADKMKLPYNAFFFVPVHTFIKVDIIEPRLMIRLTDDDEMEKLLKEDPNAVKYELVNDRLILTASTKELQAFVLKYADDSRVFTDEIVLNRKKTQDPNDPNNTDPNEG